MNTMNINEFMQQKSLTIYRVAKNSGIQYMTINDICNGKTKLDKCSADTVYRLAKVMNVTMEELLDPILAPRPAFDLFKSNVCHKLKELGDIDFLIDKIIFLWLLIFLIDYEKFWRLLLYFDGLVGYSIAGK